MKPSTVANMLALTVDEQMEMLAEDPSHIRDMLETIQRLTAAAEQHRAQCPMLMTDADVEAQLRADGFDMRVKRQGDLAQLCARLAETLPTNSVASFGTCSRCGYYGPGPAHACPARDLDIANAKLSTLVAERDELAAELEALRACWEGALELERLREAGL